MARGWRASTDHTVRLWNTRTRQPITEPLTHLATVNGVCFSPDGLRVATSDSKGRLRVWDTASGAPLTDWIVCGQGVTGVGFSPDGAKVVASTGQAWELFTAGGPAPVWLAELAEGIAGESINSAQLVEPVPDQTFLVLIQRLSIGHEVAEHFAWARRLLGLP